ncbi:MAG TPA: sulfotransferase [Mycobacteriales bacterium]|nr:sulfotransferase [Mycobacteriales bacterium]
MKRIFIHVGMPKTGTTFLQERCFPHLTGLYYLHRENYAATSPDEIIEWLARVAATDPAFLDLEREKRTLETLLETVSEESVLISLERLFGNLHYNFHNNGQTTRNLAHFFPRASIIVVIRRQDDLLESLYRQTLRRYFSPTVDGYLNYADGEFQNHSQHQLMFPSMNARQLDLHKYIRNYVATFGRDNVLVLPYEKLRSDLRGFLDELYRFMPVEPFYPAGDQRVHQSYSPLSCRIALLLNRFVRTGRDPRAWQVIPHRPFSGYLSRRAGNDPLHRLLAGIDRRLSLNYLLETVVDPFSRAGRKMISDDRRKLIMALHRESNQALDNEFHLGLAHYGYY